MLCNRRLLGAAGLALAGILAACQGSPDHADDPRDATDDVAEALRALPDGQVLHRTGDGVPRFIVGELGKLDPARLGEPGEAEAALRAGLARVVAPFRLTPGDLRLRRTSVDRRGGRHFHFQQTAEGLDVVGGELVVHVDARGAIVGVNGTARGDVSRVPAASIGADAARALVLGHPRFAGLRVSGGRPVFLITGAGSRHRAFELLVEGRRGEDPVRDVVYVDATSSAIAAVHPRIHFAENRHVHDAGHGTSLPGALRRSEGQAPTTDADVNAAYDNAGATYEAYAGFWGRDSYDGAGAVLTSSVHYSTSYCNAFWNGVQLVFGDGSGACLPLARSLDLTAHELTHAITELESGLVYSGESGALNESIADVFGAFVEAWVDGGKTGSLAVSPDTWLFGEDYLPPFVRSLCDPSSDGVSADVWSSSVGNLDVHYGSGVANLAFCLLASGGIHPRGKTAIEVPAIGLEPAIRILYAAQVDVLTSQSDLALARTAMEQAAAMLGYDEATQDAVGCAWAAVKVGDAPVACGGTPPPPPPEDGVLRSGVPVGGLGDVTGGQRFWSLVVPEGQTTVAFTISGGTGDADLYVRSGSKPTLTAYDCRPYRSGNSETCTFLNPAAGTYWVMLDGYAAYSGVTLAGRYEDAASATLANGVPVSGLSGAAGSMQYWRIATPEGRRLTIAISGGTGDADLYTRFASPPTLRRYRCRPYLHGNDEACTVRNTKAGDYHVLVRGFADFSGVSLVASY